MLFDPPVRRPPSTAGGPGWSLAPRASPTARVYSHGSSRTACCAALVLERLERTLEIQIPRLTSCSVPSCSIRLGWALDGFARPVRSRYRCSAATARSNAAALALPPALCGFGAGDRPNSDQPLVLRLAELVPALTLTLEPAADHFASDHDAGLQLLQTRAAFGAGPDLHVPALPVQAARGSTSPGRGRRSCVSGWHSTGPIRADDAACDTSLFSNNWLAQSMA